MDHVSETEKKIVRAATAVFLLKGKDGARMQEIADHAGINKALLHYYFRSKDKLYEDVFNSQLKSFFRGVLDSIQDAEDFQQVLRAFIDHYIDSITAHTDLIRFIFWESEKGGQMISKAILAVLAGKDARKNPFVMKIEAAMANRQIRQVEPLNFIISLVGQCVFPFLAKPILERIFPSLDILSPAFLQQRKEEIFNLIWNGIAPLEPDVATK